MKIKRTPSIKKFVTFPTYADSGSINQICRDLLDQGAGEASSLQIGICEITGPGEVAEDSHANWTQYFIVTEGEGTLFLNGMPHPLHANTIVEIPKNTPHHSSCAPGQFLRYFFINVHDA